MHTLTRTVTLKANCQGLKASQAAGTEACSAGFGVVQEHLEKKQKQKNIPHLQMMPGPGPVYISFPMTLDTVKHTHGSTAHFYPIYHREEKQQQQRKKQNKKNNKHVLLDTMF